MINKWTLIFWCCVCFCCCHLSVQAQNDIQFSENYATPLLLNPGMTGVMNGDMRLAAVYRTQWASISPDSPFRTITMSGEKSFSGIGSNDRFAIGGVLYSDRGGALNYWTNSLDLAAAYNLSINPQLYFSLGISGGLSQRSFDLSRAQFGDMYDPDLGTATGTTQDVLMNEKTATWSGNLAGGGMVYFAPSHRTNLYFGGGIFHLMRPDFALLENEVQTNLFSKVSMQIGGSVPLGSIIDIVPSVYYIQQGPHLKLDAGSFIRFIFSSNNKYQLDKALNVGSWLRVGGFREDGIRLNTIVLAGKLDYDNFSVGASYDLTLGNLATYNSGRGGVEVAIVYTGLGRQKQNELPCPRF